MSSDDFYLRTLQNKIDSVSNIHDLIPYLSLLPMNSVKAMIKQQIEGTFKNKQEIRSAYYNSSSIFDLLPSNVVQYIASFNSSNTIEPINSTFKSFSEQNERMKIKQDIARKYPSSFVEQIEIEHIYLNHQSSKIEAREKHIMKLHQSQQKSLKASKISINMKIRDSAPKIYALNLEKRAKIERNSNTQKHNENDDFVVDIKFDEDVNKTWIVAKNENDVHSRSLWSDPKTDEIYDSIEEVLEKCKSGDKILIYNGTYYHVNNIEYKDVQIIGMGDSVKIQDISNGDWFMDITKCKVYFENILFDNSYGTEEYEGHLLVGDDCKVYAKKCTFIFGENVIDLGCMTDLYLSDCQFIGSNSCGSALQLSPWSGIIDIRNCKFENCGQRDSRVGRPAGAASCIDIKCDRDYTSRFGAYTPFIRLRCVGCVFENNRGYPIAIQKAWKYDILSKFDMKKHFVLKDNKLEGYNGKNLRRGNGIFDANKVYYNTEIQNEDDYW